MAEVPLDPLDDDLEEFSEDPPEGGEPETPSEPIVQEKGPVPWEEFQKVYSEMKGLRQEVDTQRNYLWQQGQTIQQQMLARQRPPEPVDPQLEEVEKIIAPMIAKRLAPMEQRYQQVTMAMEAQSEAQAALTYFEAQVPYHKEIEQDFIKYLDSDPVIKARAFQDPVFAVQTAKLVKALKDTGQLHAATQTREAIRGRAKSESGGNSPTLTSQQNVDYNDMSDEDFAKMDAQIARRARR